MNRVKLLNERKVVNVIKVTPDIFRIEPRQFCLDMTREDFLAWINDMKNLAKKGSKPTVHDP